MNLPTDKVLVVIPEDDPSPVACMNLYDPGDIWVKVQGCDACSSENQKKCCGKCPHFYSKGCDWHHEKGTHKAKPLHCCILPIPSSARSHCVLVYECIKGPKRGKRRHVADRGDVLR